MSVTAVSDQMVNTVCTIKYMDMNFLFFFFFSQSPKIVSRFHSIQTLTWSLGVLCTKKQPSATPTP